MQALFSSQKDFERNLKKIDDLYSLQYTNQQVRSNVYIQLTIKTEGFKITAFQTEATDEGGNSIRLSLYNLPTTGTSKSFGGSIKSVDDFFHSDLQSIFKPGRVIYIRDPWLKVAMDGGFAIRVEDSKDIAIVRDGTLCYFCDRSAAEIGGKLSKCSKCLGAFYCSRKCQVADWKTHKKVCFDYDSNKLQHDTNRQTSSFPSS